MAALISKRAADDIFFIYLHGKRQFGERTADAYQVLLSEAVRFAATYPLASPMREITINPVRVRYFGSHLIVYDCVGDDIVVQRVLHQHRDWDAQI